MVLARCGNFFLEGKTFANVAFYHYNYVYGIIFNILGPKVCWFIKLKLIFGLGTWCSIVH